MGCMTKSERLPDAHLLLYVVMCVFLKNDDS